MHGVVAVELMRVMQGKLAEREDLRRQQVATVDWHLRERHRLEHRTQ